MSDEILVYLYSWPGIEGWEITDIPLGVKTE